MNPETLSNFRNFWRTTIGTTKPEHHNWEKRVVNVRHGRASAARHSYPATLLHPKETNWDKTLAKLAVHSKRVSLRKAVESEGKDIPAGARWVTVHPNGDEEDGHPVLITPNPDGSHTIVGGAGGKLNGTKLTGIRSEAAYAKEAKDRVAAKRTEKHLREEQLRSSLGQQAYQKLQAERETGRTQAVAQKTESETTFIDAVAKLQGVDMAQFDVKPEHAEGADPKILSRVAQQTHEKKLAWANAVASRVKDITLAAYEDVAKDAVGNIAISDIARMSTGDTGKGYQAEIAHMAAMNGLTTAGGKAIAKDTSMRGFISRSDGDLEAAKAKQEAVARLHEGARRSHEEVKRVAGEAGQADAGPQAIDRLDTTPAAKDVGEAVEILKAHALMKSAQQRASAATKEIAEVEDAARIPKSLLVVAKPMSDEEAMKAVEESLSQQAMTDAMMRVVNTTNDLEGDGTLQQHYSVGQASAINIVAQAVNGTTVDPLVMDTIGVEAVAQCLANQWRESMPKEDFDAAKRALSKQHIATQEAIANEGVSRAEAFTEAAQAIPLDVQPESAEEVEAVLSSLSERTSLLRMARESAGVARGRLEAAGAINFAMMKGKPGSVKVSMGQVPSADAAERLYAIGLNDPSKYDAQGQLVHEGDFTLHSDGTNRILELHPAGQRKLVQQADPDVQRRAAVSSAIKSGAHDEPGWVPQGLINGPQTTYEMDPLVAHSINHALQVSDEDDAESMAHRLRVHIGARINEGADPISILSDIQAVGTVHGLGLSAEGQKQYADALDAVAPAFRGARKGKDFHEGFDKHREALVAKLISYGDDYIADQKAKGVLSSDDAALDRQRVAADGSTKIDLLQAVAADPRTQNAFLPRSEVNMDHIRSYAMEHVLKVDPNDCDIVSKVTPEQAAVFRDWEAFKKEHGANGVYAAIQEHMKQSGGEDLFGDPAPVSPLASVDLGDPLSIIAAAKEAGAELGYRKQVNPQTGEMEFLELVPGMKLYNPNKDNDQGTVNTEASIAQDAKGRMRAALRKHYIGNMLGRAAVAETGWNPESVVTTDNRWDKFKNHMGGTNRAVRAVQEFMAGDVQQRFAQAYRKRTGAKMNMVFRPITDAENFTEARMNPDAIEARRAQSSSDYARVAQRAGGKFAKEREDLGRKGKVEQVKQAEQEQPKLIGETEAHGAKEQVNVHRATLGRAIEGTLRSLMPYLPIDKPVDASQGVQMSGDFINRQRATKLILENKRQGLNLGAGSGKTSAMAGAFTEAFQKGAVKRGLFLVPSNIVGQMNSEFTKFIDPNVGLRWYANPGGSGEDRRRAMADPGTHMVVMTPESLREDVSSMVGKELGMSKTEAMAHMQELPNSELDALIGDVMSKNGMDLSSLYHCEDEAHRLSNADANMSMIGNSIGRQASHYIYSTADIMRNGRADEAHAVLSKIAPDKYNESNKEAFIRKYGRDTVASGIAMRKEMEPYIFADKVNMGVDSSTSSVPLDLTDEQQKDYAKVTRAARQLKQAKAKGDTEGMAKALSVLSPDTDFSDAETVERMARSVGPIVNTAMNRVVNLHPQGAKMAEVSRYVGENKDEPTVIFAHNINSVEFVAKQLKEQGHKVAVLTGQMSTGAKAKANDAFAGNSPTANVLVCSDANAMGANLQRGMHEINYDTPDTAMLWRQRQARLIRSGQKNFVHVKDLVANCGFERRNRKRLETKDSVREIMTSPAELVDDSGLSMRIQQEKVKEALG